MNRCRVCNGHYFSSPLIVFENMPRVAQFLPDRDTISIDSGIDINVYQCSRCGLVQIDSDPVHYYREVVRSSGFSEEMNIFRNKQFKAFVDRFELGDKKIIEIGCGKGEYLKLMDKYVANAFGLEYSSESVSLCQSENLNVIRGFLDDEKITIESGPFDSFYMLNFLEHLPEPNIVLESIRNNLTDNGIGLIEVPNFTLALDKMIFSDFSTEHLMYFTRETLINTLEFNGFSVVDVDVAWYDNIISAIVRKRPQLDLLDFLKKRDELEKDVTHYLSQFRPEEIVIWGAGHQSLAAISLLKLKDKINYIVDSAPFKQGKYTPASHIPIYSPERLYEDEISVVLVNATSYSDEVANILLTNYTHINSIAILRDYGIEIKK